MKSANRSDTKNYGWCLINDHVYTLRNGRMNNARERERVRACVCVFSIQCIFIETL